MSYKLWLLTLAVVVCANVFVYPSVFFFPKLWADQRTLEVYRSVDANGVVSFSDQQGSGATAVEVHTYQPDAVAVESSADNAALTAEIADQMAEERLERLAEDRAVQVSQQTGSGLDEEPYAEDTGTSGYTNRPGYYGAYPRPPLRPYPRPEVPPVTTEVGEHFKAGWPGRLHPFGPAGANNSARSNAQ